MTTLSPAPQRVAGPLADCLVALAGTPDDSSWVEGQLMALAQLAAGPGIVRDASVTVDGDDGPVTVACSSDSAPGPDGPRARLSVPLFAGSGTTLALLNLYGDDPDGMAELADALRAAFDPDVPIPGPRRAITDPLAADLVTGVTGAFAVRAVIQQAVGILVAAGQRTPERAYVVLRMRAAASGYTLHQTATTVIGEQRW